MLTFTVNDEEQTARAAAVAYVWRHFRARAWVFIGGAVMWAAAIVYFWSKNDGQLFVGVFIVFLFFTLAYLPIFVVAMPRAASKAVRRSPSRNVSLRDDSMEISAPDAAVALPWSEFKALWEYPDFIVLPLKVGYWWLPKRGMPPGALEHIRRALPSR